MTAPSTPEMTGDFEALEEVAGQTSIRVNEKTRMQRGWSVGPNIERSSAHVEHTPQPQRTVAKKPVAAPKPAAIRITRNPEEFEVYRIVSDYEALQDGFLDRIDDLDTTQGSIPGFADGQVQKLLTKNPGKAISRPRDHRSASAKRTFGWESLGKMLEGTGLALVLVVDDERFAPVKEQLGKRRRVNKPAFAGSRRPTWLFTKKKAREMGKKRHAVMTESQRKRLARKAGKASGKARRAKRRKSALPPKGLSPLPGEVFGASVG